MERTWDYLGHINTATLARDLELIRSLTSYDQLDYWGTDYGSVVGVAYAALFPDRVGRMILDGMFIIKLANE
jgi:pimeloyl-ACP methyl ester carboxylesterase